MRTNSAESQPLDQSVPMNVGANGWRRPRGGPETGAPAVSRQRLCTVRCSSDRQPSMA